MINNNTEDNKSNEIQEKELKSKFTFKDTDNFTGKSSTKDKGTTVIMGKKELTGAVLPTIIFTSDSEILISREDLKQILILENEIRLSNETLEALDSFNLDYGKFFAYDEEIIRKGLKKFGFNPDVDDSYKAYLLATGRYQNDKELKELVVWLKYDKMRMGDLRKGDQFISESVVDKLGNVKHYGKNVEIYSLDNKCYKLEELISDTKYNIIVSGSYS